MTAFEASAISSGAAAALISRNGNVLSRFEALGDQGGQMCCVRKAVWLALFLPSLLFCAVAQAQQPPPCPDPNPNTAAGAPGYPFFDNCEVKSSGLNKLPTVLGTPPPGDPVMWGLYPGTANVLRDAAIPTNAALKAFSTSGFTSGQTVVSRTGFYAPGDGGARVTFFLLRRAR
jgi:hypothetical protein